ncbi:MAG: hypothetical protein U0031_02020 [Thermomicrobiales bacterium]
MDGAVFDRWTRRRFGLAAGGMVAALTRRGEPDDTVARKRRKIRCKRLGDRCTPGSKRKCCKDLKCDLTFASSPDAVCCKQEGEICQADGECCDIRRRCRTNGCSNPDLACCGVTGAACVVDCDCCEGFNCLGDGECG